MPIAEIDYFHTIVAFRVIVIIYISGTHNIKGIKVKVLAIPVIAVIFSLLLSSCNRTDKWLSYTKPYKHDKMLIII